MQAQVYTKLRRTLLSDVGIKVKVVVVAPNVHKNVRGYPTMKNSWQAFFSKKFCFVLKNIRRCACGHFLPLYFLREETILWKSAKSGSASFGPGAASG